MVGYSGIVEAVSVLMIVPTAIPSIDVTKGERILYILSYVYCFIYELDDQFGSCNFRELKGVI